MELLQFFSTEKTRSVSLIGIKKKRTRVKEEEEERNEEKGMILTRKKEARFDYLLFTHLLQENETFHLVRKIRDEFFTKRCKISFTRVMFFFFFSLLHNY